MNRVLILGSLLALVFVVGCPKRDQPPDSAYDPELMKTARELVQEGDAPVAEGDTGTGDAPEQGECDRETGGCPEGHLCWDSWYCKQGRDDQCSAMGDKRCHKVCGDDSDCPKDMPRCEEKPVFKGSDRGVLEKFCVAAEE